jgi:hypothetical protein
MKKAFLALHRTRGVSARASEIILTRPRVDERSSRKLTAKGRRAGINAIEAFAAGREPREEDALAFFDAVAPTHAQWLREQIAKAEQMEREMESDSDLEDE